jgi:uroporphyrinogen decarboxylase
VDARDIRSFILPAGWDAENRRLKALGVQGPLYRGQRGPVTFATSVFGPVNLIFLILDRPELAARLRDTILRVMLAIGRVLDEEAGYTPDTAPHGFGFADDNCALLNREMYEFFGYPVLKGIFDRYSPKPGDSRYQHSDSAMAHLLPVLGRLHMTGVNFGPTVTVSEIRAHLPRAVIHGQLAPFTFSRNDEEGLVYEFLRDFEQARAERGLVFSTAGSINNGSRLTGMRLLMAAIQRYGRYG